MSKIENLQAYNIEAPGQPACFEVRGTVTVGHPGIVPVLIEPRVRHRGGWEVLELHLVDNGEINLQVLTQKPVFYRRERASSWTRLEIIKDDGPQMFEIGHRVVND